MANIATLTARLEAEIRDFDRDMRQAERRLDSVESSTRRSSRSFDGLKRAFVGVGLALGAQEVLQFAAATAKMAISAEEAGAAFETTFGPATEEASRFVEEFANRAGFAEFELQQLLATTGNVVQGIGGTADESARMAEEMARLAGDVASFSNAAGGANAVLSALQSALTGEREALKTYGLVISEAEVQQRALNDSGKEAVSDLTRLEKAQATLNLAYERANNAVGDLDRTQDSLANRLREANAQWKEAQTQIGQALLPAVEALVRVLPDVISGVQSSTETIVGWIRAIGDARSELEQLQRIEAVTDGRTVSLEESQSQLVGIYRDSVDVFQQVLNEAANVAVQFEETGEFTRDLADKTDTLKASQEAATDRMLTMNAAVAGVTTTTGGYSQEAESADRATIGFAASLGGVVANAEAVDVRLQRIKNSVRELTDPVFAAAEANRRLDEAFNRVIELEFEGAEGTADYERALEDLVTAASDADTATRDLSTRGLADAQAAMDLIAQRFGIGTDAVQRYTDAVRIAAGLTIGIPIGGELTPFPQPTAPPPPVGRGGGGGSRVSSFSEGFRGTTVVANISGTFDPTDPAAARSMINNITDAARRRSRELR